MEKYGLIGGSLAHSMSPFIHNALFKLSNRDAVYDLYEVPSVKSFVDNNPDMNGYSVTIPHKEDGYLMVNSLHESALPYGAINCVDSKGVGYNTDVDGFRMSISEVVNDFNVKALLLGFGGVGKMIAKQFNCDALTIAVRNNTDDKINAIKKMVGSEVRVVEFDNIPNEKYDLLVNATPIGMYPKSNNCPVNESVIDNCNVVYDTIYNPLETQLIKTATKLGKTVKGGIDMLVYQAVVAHKYWYGAEFKKEQVDKIISDVENVLLQKEWL